MANSPLPSNAMTVRLSDPAYWHKYENPLTLFHDLPPCDIAAPKTEVICIVCQKPGSLRCSRCHDAQYCSTNCQYSDWGVHKLICEKLSSFSSEPRPSKDHFRVLIFPYEASSPEFCWGVFKKHKIDYEVDELIIVHSTIDSWMAANEGQYTGPYEFVMRVRALSRDSATHGKILGHALRIASYKSSRELFSHLGGFNEAVLSLAGPLSERFYGPLVALAYNLDSRCHFETMDDISSADFGALVDVFHKSDWNPTVGRVEGYPKKTVSALFLPDVFNFHRIYSSYPETASESPDELSIRRLIGAQDTIVEVNIAATPDSKQLCSHSSCDFDATSIKALCLNGRIFHALLLGPLLLDLPWIGRNAWFTDSHIDPPEYRWQESRCRFLRRGIFLCYKSLGIKHVPEKDGLIVFSAFGVKISPLHLIAYDEFLFRQLQTEKSKRQLSKAGFLSFWNDLKSGKVKITNELKKPQYSQLDLLEFWGDSTSGETQTTTHAELDFSEESSPYDCPVDAKSILTEDETQVLLYIRKLFRDPDFVRPNQRNWLEVLYDANAFIQDRKLGPDYWADELDKFFSDDLSSSDQD